MLRRTTLLAASLLLFAAPARAADEETTTTVELTLPVAALASASAQLAPRATDLHLSFVPGLDNAGLAARVAPRLSLGVIGTGTYGLEGLQLATIFNVNEGYTHGAQGAAIFNLGGQEVHGIQAAGVFNMAPGELHGFQGAGVFNMAHGEVHGAQLANVFNMAQGEVHGAQAAGVFNMAHGELHGAQAAGVFNMAADVHGVQAATLFNVAREVHGLQLGLVNVAEDVQGVAVGLVSYVERGVHNFQALAAQDGLREVSFNSGSRLLYNCWSLGYRWQGNMHTYLPGFGLGWHQDLIGPVYHEFEVLARAPYALGDGAGPRGLVTVREAVGWRLGPSLMLELGVYGDTLVDGRTPGVVRVSYPSWTAPADSLATAGLFAALAY